MVEAALNGFGHDDPADLDFPEYELTGCGAMPVAFPDADAKSGQSVVAFSSLSLSVASHVFVAVLGLVLAVSPQMPAQVISIALVPGMMAAGASDGPEMPAAPAVSHRVPKPDAQPAPIPETKVEKKVAQPAVKPEVKTPKPLPRKTEKKPLKEDVAPENKPLSPVTSPDVGHQSSQVHNATTVLSQSGREGGEAFHAMTPGQFVNTGGSVGGTGPIASRFGDANGPRFVQRVMPKYPELARRRGREGVVVLRLTIGACGELKDAVVVEGGGNGFEDAALAAVRASTYAPATKQGESVECSALLPIRFALKNS